MINEDERVSKHSKENGMSEDDVIGKPLRRTSPAIANGWEFVLAAGSKWGFPAVMCLILMGWVWFLTTSNQKAAAEAHVIFAESMAAQSKALTEALGTETGAIRELGAEQKITNQKLTQVDAALDAHLRREH